MLRQIPVTTMSSASPFFNFLNMKKTCANESHEKKNILMFQLLIYYILEKEISLGANARSSSSDVFCKNRVLKNFAKCTGKHLWRSLFCSDVAGLGYETLLKKGFWKGCFRVNFAKSLRTFFFNEHLQWLLLNCEHCKNKEKKTDCLMLKSRVVREASHHPAFISFATISITRWSYLPIRWVHLFAPGVAESNKQTGRI